MILRKSSPLQDLAGQMLNNLTSQLNFQFRNFNSGIYAKVPLLSESQSIEVVQGSGMKALYDNEVENGFLIATDKNNLINAHLSVQGGKTAAAILANFIERLILHFDNRKCEFLYLVPAEKSIEAMTTIDYKKILHLFKYLVFTKNGLSVPFIDIVRGGMGERNIKDGFAPKIYAVTGKKSIGLDIAKHIDYALSRNIKLITTWDEAHYAENKKSNFENLIGKLLSDIVSQIENTIHKFVFLSATPFNYVNL